MLHEKESFKPAIPVKQITMASYKNNSFNFMADFCNEVNCLKGLFADCHKCHQIITRESRDQLEDHNLIEKSSSCDDEDKFEDESQIEFNILLSDDPSLVPDEEIQFIDSQEDSSVLDHLVDDSYSEHDDIILVSDDEEADVSTHIMKKQEIFGELKKNNTITNFSANNEQLSQVHLEEPYFKTFQIFMACFESEDAHIGHCYGFDLRKKDFSCLNSGTMLNDNIINVGLSLIQEKILAHGIELEIVPSHWYSQYLVSSLLKISRELFLFQLKQNSGGWIYSKNPKTIWSCNFNENERSNSSS